MIGVEPYTVQAASWPAVGRHILAHYDAESIWVYQAYRPETAQYALLHQRFGGPWSINRMSWIKPNFLWMMYRSGWATKKGQEYVLAVRLQRAFFDEALRQAVPSQFNAERYDSVEQWRKAVAQSEVRLQWDPDHDPAGIALPRRALQLGLRGRMLRRYADEALLGIEDLTPFVHEQRLRVGSDALLMPDEGIYRPTDPVICTRLGLDSLPPSRR